MQPMWRGLIKPKALDVERESLTGTYGKFVARPLERGFGTTLGNSLRRVLLSSLQGAAITQIKIEGAQHEFGTLANVKEDVAEILLNLKDVRFKLYNASEVRLTIEKHGPGQVTAGDISTTDQCDVVNPAQLICTLGPGAVFKAEILVAVGRGYVPADTRPKGVELPLGTLVLDAFYSPVKKVNYLVTNSRVGQRTDFDKLTLEVWTDGSITPEDAISLGSKILRDQLNVFMNFIEESEPDAIDEKEERESINANLYRTVDELELSVRSANCLQNANIKYIYELVTKTEAEMLKTKNFGRKSLNEIKEILSNMGLGLGIKLDNFVPPDKLPGASSKSGKMSKKDEEDDLPDVEADDIEDDDLEDDGFDDNSH